MFRVEKRDKQGASMKQAALRALLAVHTFTGLHDVISQKGEFFK
jgi:hypothetical protein